MTDLDSLQDEIIVSRIYSALNQYRYAQQRIDADTARINPIASGSTIYVNLQSDNANSPIRKLATTTTDFFEGDAKQDTGIDIDKIDIVRREISPAEVKSDHYSSFGAPAPRKKKTVRVLRRG